MVKLVDDYMLHQVLGEGSYGKVYRAVNKKNNKQFAIKAIDTRKIKTDPIVAAGVANEIKILKRLQRCNNIVQFFQTMKSPNHMYFVYEYCNGGTLQSMINKNKTLPQKTALKIFKEMLEAFKILDKHYIIHRDVKPQNIYFSDGQAKLGDFGFCKNLGKNKMTRTMLGSPVYMAPEVIKQIQYSSKADIWSLGVVLYQMLYGTCPFQSSNIAKLIKVLDATQLSFPANIYVSSQTKDLLKKMLVKNQKFRIEWSQLFKLPITKQGEFADMSKIQKSLGVIKKFEQLTSKTHTKIMSSARLTLQDIGKKPTSQIKIGHKKTLKNDEILHSRDKKKDIYRRQPTDRSTSNSKKLQTALSRGKNQDFSSSSSKLLYKYEPISSRGQNSDFLSNESSVIEKFVPIKTENSISYQRSPLKNKTNNNNYKQIKQIKKQIEKGKSKLQMIDEFHSIIKGVEIAKEFLKTPARHSTLFSIIVMRGIIKRLEQFKEEIQRNQNCIQIHKNVLIQLKQLNQEINKLEQQNLFIMEMINQYEQNQRLFLSEKVPQCKNWKLCYEMIGYLKRLQLQEPDQSNIRLLQRQVKNMLLSY